MATSDSDSVHLDQPAKGRAGKHRSWKTKAALTLGIGVPLVVVTLPDAAAADPGIHGSFGTKQAKESGTSDGPISIAEANTSKNSGRKSSETGDDNDQPRPAPAKLATSRPENLGPVSAAAPLNITDVGYTISAAAERQRSGYAILNQDGQGNDGSGTTGSDGEAPKLAKYGGQPKPAGLQGSETALEADPYIGMSAESFAARPLAERIAYLDSDRRKPVDNSIAFAPLDFESTDFKSTDPEPTDPESTDFEPTDPESTDFEPIDPELIDPELIDPEPITKTDLPGDAQPEEAEPAELDMRLASWASEDAGFKNGIPLTVKAEDILRGQAISSALTIGPAATVRAGMAVFAGLAAWNQATRSSQNDAAQNDSSSAGLTFSGIVLRNRYASRDLVTFVSGPTQEQALPGREPDNPTDLAGPAVTGRPVSANDPGNTSQNLPEPQKDWFNGGYLAADQTTQTTGYPGAPATDPALPADNAVYSSNDNDDEGASSKETDASNENPADQPSQAVETGTVSPPDRPTIGRYSPPSPSVLYSGAPGSSSDETKKARVRAVRLGLKALERLRENPDDKAAAETYALGMAEVSTYTAYTNAMTSREKVQMPVDKMPEDVLDGQLHLLTGRLVAAERELSEALEAPSTVDLEGYISRLGKAADALGPARVGVHAALEITVRKIGVPSDEPNQAKEVEHAVEALLEAQKFEPLAVGAGLYSLEESLNLEARVQQTLGGHAEQDARDIAERTERLTSERDSKQNKQTDSGLNDLIRQASEMQRSVYLESLQADANALVFASASSAIGGTPTHENPRLQELTEFLSKTKSDEKEARRLVREAQRGDNPSVDTDDAASKAKLLDLEEQAEFATIRRQIMGSAVTRATVLSNAASKSSGAKSNVLKFPKR